MSAIKLSTPSSGSISLSPANTASNLTITVPAVTGTMLTTASTGTVLQVVSANYSTYTSTTSTTLVSTGLTASITPTSSSSKILVMVNPLLALLRNSAGAQVALQIVRGATSIYSAERSLSIDTGTFLSANVGITVLDSPATTSSTTYTLNFSCYNGNASSIRLNDYSTIPPTVGSTITLMEIAA
jgi:hypothetical protein